MLTESRDVSALLKTSFGGTLGYLSYLHGLADMTLGLGVKLDLPTRWATGEEAGCTHSLK